jgi:GNAT superfamily N-acetyltransferase
MSSGRMSLLSPPSFAEARLYLRHNGPWRSMKKFMAGYVVGRQSWHVTLEDLREYGGKPMPNEGVELRFARLEDLPLMWRFTTRIAPSVLRAWCGPSYYFFIALVDGEPVSYRCLSTRLHPGVSELIRLEPGQLFMVDEFTDPAFRRRGITRQLAHAMTPTLQAWGIREVLGVHRTDNHDTIAAARKKGIPRLGTITRYRVLWKVWFDYVDAEDSAGTARERAESELGQELSERGV